MTNACYASVVRIWNSRSDSWEAGESAFGSWEARGLANRLADLFRAEVTKQSIGKHGENERVANLLTWSSETREKERKFLFGEKLFSQAAGCRISQRSGTGMFQELRALPSCSQWIDEQYIYSFNRLSLILHKYNCPMERNDFLL